MGMDFGEPRIRFPFSHANRSQIPLISMKGVSKHSNYPDCVCLACVETPKCTRGLCRSIRKEPIDSERIPRP